MPATVLLVDEMTGMPSALMDATFLTALRTAAGSGAATDRLARTDATVLTVFGAGMQAEAHIDAVMCVRPGITTLNIVNRTARRAYLLVAACTARYPGLRIVGVTLLGDDDAVASAVRTADIICTTTNASEPVFKGAWLAPGTHINGVGSYTPQMQELDVATVRQCHVVVDSEHALAAGDLAIPLQDDTLMRANVIELGGLLAGESEVPRAGSTSTGASCTFFKSVGTAIQDVATAAAVLKQARSKGIGKRVSF